MSKQRTEAAALAAAVLCALTVPAWGQTDPGVRGGLQNTGGGLQQQGIPIPHPPIMSPNPNHPELTMNVNEQSVFMEGIKRAAQLESICDSCLKTYSVYSKYSQISFESKSIQYVTIYL